MANFFFFLFLSLPLSPVKSTHTCSGGAGIFTPVLHPEGVLRFMETQGRDIFRTHQLIRAEATSSDL